MKEQQKEKVYIYFRESALQSLVSDAGSILVAILGMWLNYHYFGDSWVWGLFFSFIFLLFLAGKGKAKSQQFTSLESLKAHVNSL